MIQWGNFANFAVIENFFNFPLVYHHENDFKLIKFFLMCFCALHHKKIIMDSSSREIKCIDNVHFINYTV